MKHKLLCALLTMPIILCSCSTKHAISSSSPANSSSNVSLSSEVSNPTSTPQSASPSGYTSIELEIHDVAFKDGVEIITVTDVEIISKIDAMVVKMLENESDPIKPTAGGIPDMVRLYKSERLEAEYGITDKASAKKEGEIYVQWYTCDAKLQEYINDLVPPHD